MDRYAQRRLTGRPTRNRDGWREELTDIDPERRLMAAVIWWAVADVGSTPALARRAWRYIHSDGFAADCAWIGIDPDYIRGRLPESTIIRA
ncbi:MAG TPA: hypothetical protein PLC06_14180 [Promineifilum sp.]|nr:hypothetical protein [Promineifilum sp.]